MSRSKYQDVCECGAAKQVAADRCHMCAAAARLNKAPSKQRDIVGIPDLEPSRSWACPDCTYRITDERSVVNDAVLEHQRAHKRVTA